MDHETIELLCIGLGAFALLMQSVVLLAIYLGVSKATKEIKEMADEMRTSVIPVVENTRDLLKRVTPKVDSTVTEFAELAHTLRSQAANIDVAVDQILDRVRRQTSRIDTMFSGTLDAVDKASAFVAETVSKPVRQLSGMLASVKAIVESLRASDPSFHEPNVRNDPNGPSDKDMFI